MSGRFSWGDTVRISPDASLDKRPGEVGDICGIRTEPYKAGVIDVAAVGEEVTLIFLVEFPGGEAVEVPEALLERLENEDPHHPCDEEKSVGGR
jgi:hypothetical protein